MTLLEQKLEEVLLSKIKTIGGGEHTYSGTPQELLTALHKAVKSLLLRRATICPI